MARRLPGLDGARHLDRATVQQQLFGQRGLARVGWEMMAKVRRFSHRAAIRAETGSDSMKDPENAEAARKDAPGGEEAQFYQISRPVPHNPHGNASQDMPHRLAHTYT